MILIQRGQEPGSLLRYRKSNPDACYDELPPKEKEDIRKQMWEEQGHLCAYCMRNIKHPNDVRIEHYRAQNPENEDYNAASTLDYKNMLGVCYGNSLVKGTDPEDMTCDAHRKNEKLTINPYDIRSIRKIKYTTDGYITSDDADINKDVDQTLNLNCKSSSLPENRKAVLEAEKKNIETVCKGKGHNTYLTVLQKRYEHYLTEGERTPYSGIVIAWLEKLLKIV